MQALESIVHKLTANRYPSNDSEKIPIVEGFQQTSNGCSATSTEKEVGILSSAHKDDDKSNIFTDGCQGNHKSKRNGEVEKTSITSWDAGWNVSNATQGLFVLGLPYAILHGGYFGFALIVVTAVVCYYTGSILIDCLYHQDAEGNQKRTRSSYVEVASDCMGHRWGSLVVNVSQLIELLMTCVLYVVVCGNLLANSFPHAPVGETGWAVMAAILLLLCIFLRDLKAVSRLSMACSMAQLVVMLITMVYCMSRIKSWSWSKVKISIDAEFPVSVGVIVFSYTSQIFLPSLEGSMEKKEEFKPMLFWSYVASCVVKALFAMACFLTWAETTRDVATDNLPSGIRIAVNVVLVVKALLSYPLPYYLSVEVLEQQFFTNATGGWGSLFKTKRNTYTQLSETTTPTTSQTTSFATFHAGDGSDDEETKKRIHSVSVTLDNSIESRAFPSCYAASGQLQLWALALRALLVLSTLLMAISIPHFALLMGLTGSLTGTALAFLLPCTFHLRLKWRELSWKVVLVDVGIFLVGVLFLVTGIYYSIIALYKVYNPVMLASPFSNSSIHNQTDASSQWLPGFPGNRNKQSL